MCLLIDFNARRALLYSAPLNQLDDEGVQWPIAFYSKLSKGEQNYHSTRLKCLALVEASWQYPTEEAKNGFNTKRLGGVLGCGLAGARSTPQTCPLYSH